jgi:primary-amine oxidase
MPSRYARATVMIGATNSTDSYWQEYMIGPLPATNVSDILPLTYPFNSQKPGQTKVHPIFSSTDGSLAVTSLSAQVGDITKAIWNTVSFQVVYDDSS